MEISAGPVGFEFASCTGETPRRRPDQRSRVSVHFNELTDADYQYGFERKFLAQTRLVEIGRDIANDGASITLSSGFLSDYPNPASVATGPLNAAVDAFVLSAAPLLPRGIRLNVVSPAPVADEGKEGRGTITATQAANAYIEAVNGDFTGQVLRPWGGLPRT